MIAFKLKITQPAVSQHLKILKINGIVEGIRTGSNIHYKIKEEVFKKYGIDLGKIIKLKKTEVNIKN